MRRCFVCFVSFSLSFIFIFTCSCIHKKIKNVVNNEETPSESQEKEPSELEIPNDNNSDEIIVQYTSGKLKFSIINLDFANSWSEMGITYNKLAHNYNSSQIMLIKIRICNIDIPCESMESQEFLANCFCLTTMKEIERTKEIAEYSQIPVGLGGREASYFNEMHLEDDDSVSIKRYFQFTLPEPGKYTDIILGWSISLDDIDSFYNGELCLLHIFSTLDSLLQLQICE